MVTMLTSDEMVRFHIDTESDDNPMLVVEALVEDDPDQRWETYAILSADALENMVTLGRGRGGLPVIAEATVEQAQLAVIAILEHPAPHAWCAEESDQTAQGWWPGCINVPLYLLSMVIHTDYRFRSSAHTPYSQCVDNALTELVNRGLVNQEEHIIEAPVSRIESRGHVDSHSHCRLAPNALQATHCDELSRLREVAKRVFEAAPDFEVMRAAVSMHLSIPARESPYEPISREEVSPHEGEYMAEDSMRCLEQLGLLEPAPIGKFRQIVGRRRLTARF